MTLADVRSAAVDRALVGDDPATALALAGVADAAIDADGTVDDPFAAAMLAVGFVGRDRRRSLDDRAWRPGGHTDEFVVAGAAVAVRSRDVSIDRAAALANCSAATLEAAVRRRKKKTD